MDKVQIGLLSVILGLLIVLGISFYTSDFRGASGVTSEFRKPTFLVLGHTNAGKTALYYRLTNGDFDAPITPTVLLIEPNFGSMSVPFLSPGIAKSFQIVDFPGHLKYEALLSKLILDEITLKQTKGVLYVIDSSSSPAELKEIARALFKLLAITERKPGGIDFLFALNKKDLFNLRPVFKIQEVLQQEINTLVTETLSEKFSAQSDLDEDADLEDLTHLKEFWLSVVGGLTFRFDMLEGNMEFMNGSVLKGNTDSWENWIDGKVVN